MLYLYIDDFLPRISMKKSEPKANGSDFFSMKVIYLLVLIGLLRI